MYRYKEHSRINPARWNNRNISRRQSPHDIYYRHRHPSPLYMYPSRKSHGYMSLFQRIQKSTHYSMHPDCIAIYDDGNPAIPLRHTSHYPAHESEQHIHPRKRSAIPILPSGSDKPAIPHRPHPPLAESKKDPHKSHLIPFVPSYLHPYLYKKE